MFLWFLIPEGGRCRVESMNLNTPGRSLLQMLYPLCLLLWGLMGRVVMMGWIRRRRVKLNIGDLIMVVDKEMFLVQVVMEVLGVVNMVGMVLVKLGWTKEN